jgi:methylmalonyl-CoA mutase
MIEEAAIRKQAAIDRGDEVIVGVNKFRPENEEPVKTREIDNKAVREAQIARLKRIKERRDPEKVAVTLAVLEAVARTGDGNILAAAIEAARVRATVGEISDCLRKAFGEHSAMPKLVRGVYGGAFRDDPEYNMLIERITNFANGKPKVMIAKLGQDGHDRGAKTIASAFRDLGFEVVAGSLFQTPAEAATMAVNEKVQVVGVSSLAAGHKTLLPQLVEALKAKGGEDIIVVCGGIVPRGDYQYLYDHGVAAIFGPGSHVLESARAILDLLEGRRRNA